MPPRKKNTTEHQRGSEPEPEPCRPHTRQKNATQRPGIEAERTLRVRRDPAVIQEEKEARKRKKEEKQHAQQEEAANNEAAARFVEENRHQQKVAMAKEQASMPRRKPQAMPCQSKESSNTTTLPTVKASGTMSTSNQKHSQKRGAGDLFSDLTELELTGDDENERMPAKKRRTSPKPNKQVTQVTSRPAPRPIGKSGGGRTTKTNATEAEDKVRGGDDVYSGAAKRRTIASNDTDRNLETPCRPVKKAKTRGIQRTETLIQLDCPVSSRNDDLSVDEDATPRQRDFRADETSDAPEDEPAEVSSEVDDEPWPTPSALKKGHSFNDTFQRDTDSDSNSEREHISGMGDGGEGKYHMTSIMQSPSSARHANPGSPLQPSSDHNGRNTHVSSSVASRTTSKIISSVTGSQKTSTFNGVVAIQKNGDRASISRSRSKPPRVAQRVDLTEDGGSTDDEPVVGGLQDEDESLEHAAALASPIKGSESRKITKGHIKVSSNEPRETDSDRPSTEPLNDKFKDIVVPYWVQFRIANGDPWKDVDSDDVDFIKEFWPRVFGEALQDDIKKGSPMYKKLHQRLWDYRNRMKAKAEQAIVERFKKLHRYDMDAIRDREKRIEFGTEWCGTTTNDYKFIWQGYDKTPGKRSGKFTSAIIIETLSLHFHLSKPEKKVPNVPLYEPKGGLALTLAALERAFSLFRDDNYEYQDNQLVVKKLLIEVPKKKPTLDGKNKDKGTRNARLDFSATNNGATTMAWIVAINKKDGILPIVHQRALAVSGADIMGSTSKLVNDRADIDSESE